MSIQALREQRAAKAKELHELNEQTKDKKWTAENQATYDAAMAEIDELDGRIKRVNDVNARLAEDALNNNVIEAAERIGKDRDSEGCKLFAKWQRFGSDGLTAEERIAIQNTMSTTTGSQGGYSVPTEVATNLIELLKMFGGMRKVASVLRTSAGNDIQFPTTDGTSETGEILAQNATAASADPTLGSVTLSTYKFSSKVVAVPIELLQDSVVDIEAWINRRLAQRLGRITNTKFTVGSGSGEPNGVVTASSVGKTGTTGQTGTVIYDDLIDLQHSVDPAYRELGNCRFMMNDASVKVIRKIKDSQNRPIFLPGYEEAIPAEGKPGGIPNTLLGDPIQVNQDVATMAANAKSILYGDFSYYTIRDVLDMQMFRFTDSAYAKNGQVGFLAFLRAGGNLLDNGGAVRYYANSAT